MSHRHDGNRGGLRTGICGDLGAAERREWLCTNGIGGFAAGTVAGTATRRYHGLLVAALKPPLGRTLRAWHELGRASTSGPPGPVAGWPSRA